MICKRCEEEFTPSKGFVNYCSPSCRVPPHAKRGGWNKGIKGSTGNHQGANNSIHIWARNDPEGFRREQSRKTTISNEKSPRKGGWQGGGMNKRPSDYTEYQGAFMTASMREHFELHMNKE